MTRTLYKGGWRNLLALLLLGIPTVSGFLVTSPIIGHPPPTQRLPESTARRRVVVHQSDNKASPFFVSGPDAETKPDYDNIHGPMGKAVDDVLLSMFRTRLAEQVGVDSDKPKVRSKYDRDFFLRYICSIACC